MNKINILVFVAGVAIGSLVTWRLVEAKYKKISDDEIASVKEVFSKKNPKFTGAIEVSEEDDPYICDKRTEYQKQRDEAAREYSETVNNLGYSKKEEEKEIHVTDPSNPPVFIPPYIISPDVFGMDDRETESLTYYTDGTLTDDWDNPITDVEGTVGYDVFDHFGEYEEDSVFVRNDNFHIDYEILRDVRDFEDVPKNGG